jgi:nicotinamide-nucleotide amidase
MKAPHIEILTIGREILDGRVVDTNSVFIAEMLRSRGLVPRFGSRVDDDRKRLAESFAIAASRADIVICTGGLGPTSDDLTLEVFAEFLGVPWIENKDALQNLSDRLEKLGRPVTETQAKQARFPQGAKVLKNDWGTAPGCFLSQGTRVWIFLPGVPREMKPMFEREVLPLLPMVPNYQVKTWATHFIAEASLQDLLRPIEHQLPSSMEITYRTRFPENHIGLTGPAGSEFEQISKSISTAIGNSVFSTSNTPHPPSLESRVIVLATEKKILLTTAESCTGGLVASRLTDVSGSSAVFWNGTVTYANEAKTQFGVDSAILQNVGAVSADVAKQLAILALQKLQIIAPANSKILAVSTTGIAGPTGGSTDKPVGLCYVGLATSDGVVVVEEVRGRVNDRMLLKTLFAQKALDLLRKHLEDSK